MTSGRSWRSGGRAALVALALVLALFARPSSAQTVSAAEEADVRAALGQWLAAWRAQDLGAYLDAYAADAVVDSRNRAQFADHKQRVFARAERPVIEIGDLALEAVTVGGERLVRASFDQSYRAPSLEDFGRKELLLRSLGGRWLIARETWRPATGAIEVPFAATAPAPPPARPAAEPAAPAAVVPRDEDEAPLLGSEGYVPPRSAGAGASPAPPSDDYLEAQPLLPPPPPSYQPLPGLPPELLDGGRRVVEEIVARVNGRVLTRSMFLDRLGWYQDTLLAEDPPDLEQRLASLAAETLDTTIDRWILLQEAKERSADVEGFWRDWLTQFRAQIGAADMAELDRLLTEQGTTLARLKEQVVETEIPNLYLQQVIAGRLTFSEAELQAFFEKHRAEFQPPALVTFRQILIPVGEAGDPAKAEALARTVIDELAKGRDWCELNSVYGQEGSSCDDLADIGLADLLPELREAAAGLPLGAVGKPIRSAQGFHVLRVSARKGAEPVTYEEAREAVLRAMRSEVFDAEMERVLTDLRASAEIEVNPRYPSDRSTGDGGVSQ